jgi:RNA polymerase sigma factor (TIGR02999 family)
MPPPPRSEITALLRECHARGVGAADASRRLFELVYDELRRLAAALMRRERPDHTLQPTAVVHEAFLKLVGPARIEWKDRAHFMGIAARAMRQILVDHARRHRADKRGGGLQRVTLTAEEPVSPHDAVEILELHDVLERFARLDERAAQVVELRVFGGLSVQETAHLLAVSPRTVDGDWAVARMWLSRELRGEGTR